MNAAAAAREVRYVNRHVRSFPAWVGDNTHALAERYYALSVLADCAQEPAELDFFEFCAEQYSHQLELLGDDR